MTMSGQIEMFTSEEPDPERASPARTEATPSQVGWQSPGPGHFARVADDPITRAQLRLPPLPATLRTREEYRRAARWWELEARRGRPSASRSLAYGANMRWLAELAGLHGPGTMAELVARAGTRVRMSEDGLLVPECDGDSCRGDA